MINKGDKVVKNKKVAEVLEVKKEIIRHPNAMYPYERVTLTLKLLVSGRITTAQVAEVSTLSEVQNDIRVVENDIYNYLRKLEELQGKRAKLVKLADEMQQ